MSHPFKNLRIRPLDKTPEAGQLLHQVAESGYETGAPWTVNQYEESVQQERLLYLIAETEEGEAIGYVGAAIAGTEADIHGIAVAQSAKQRGIGYQLLSQLSGVLKEEGLEAVFLEVRESNLPAVKLYEKSGFQRIGKRPNYYSSPSEDAYVMKKQLS